MDNVTSSETDTSPDGSISNGADATPRSEEIIEPIEESVESTNETSDCSAGTSRMYMNVDCIPMPTFSMDMTKKTDINTQYDSGDPPLENYSLPRRTRTGNLWTRHRCKSISARADGKKNEERQADTVSANTHSTGKRTGSSGRSIHDSIENPSLHFTSIAAGSYARNSFGPTDELYIGGDDGALNSPTLSAIIKAIKDSTESINRTISEKMRDTDSLSRPRSAVSSSNSLPTASRFHSLGANSPSPSVHTAQSTVHRSYSPGVVSDMVREIRENSRVREEALMTQMRTMMDEHSLTQNKTLKRLARDVEDLKRSFQSLQVDVESLKTGFDDLRSEVNLLNFQTLKARTATAVYGVDSGGNGNGVRRESYYDPYLNQEISFTPPYCRYDFSCTNHAVPELRQPVVYELPHNGNRVHHNPLPMRNVGLTVRDDLPTRPSQNSINAGHAVVVGSVFGVGGNVDSTRREDLHKVLPLSSVPVPHGFCNTEHEHLRPTLVYEMVPDSNQDTNDGGIIAMRLVSSNNLSMSGNNLAASQQDTMPSIIPPSTGLTSGQSPALPRDNTSYVSLLTGPVTDL
ncbi:uncharacterized protein LOC131213993 isoform X2 [Anopheles bellator]|uniref:uncharacterized protein LOC131213993 isoform X2 n=1 Tax=Anopheles bellator TaxID=139047 RepID=UPI002648DF4C|nr:uncharacterized protein LOC131213993 isoform X2 [Anopheles bellator]